MQQNGWLHCSADPDLIFGTDIEAKYDRAHAEDRHPPRHAVQRSRPRLTAMAAVRTGLLFAAVFAAMAAAIPASAAEINVISAGAVRGVVGGMIDDYARETGHKFNFTIGPTGHAARHHRVGQAGRPHHRLGAADGASLKKTGKITPGSRVDIGRVGLGVVVRDGAPVPDISTPEAVKQALLKATTIAYTDPKLGGDLGRRI